MNPCEKATNSMTINVHFLEVFQIQNQLRNPEGHKSPVHLPLLGHLEMMWRQGRLVIAAFFQRVRQGSERCVVTGRRQVRCSACAKRRH